MPQTCVLCKQADSTAIVKIQNPQTEEYSVPVPVCPSCLERISKTRKVEIMQNRLQKEPEQDDREDESYKEYHGYPLYRANVWKIYQWLRGFMFAYFIIAIISGFLGFVGLFNSDYSIYEIVGISICVGSILSGIMFYIFSLIAEAVYDYFKIHKK